jgi:hypothetical protein
MAGIIKNDASMLIANGNHQTVATDGTSKTIGDEVTLNKSAPYHQIQIQGAGAKFHLSGEDATSGSPFIVAQNWTAVWATAQLSKSTWTQDGVSGTLVI